MKKILIITERRADFSRFKPIIKLIQKGQETRLSAYSNWNTPGKKIWIYHQ